MLTQDMYAIISPANVFFAVGPTEDNAWRRAKDIAHCNQQYLERQGFKCVPVEVRQTA